MLETKALYFGANRARPRDVMIRLSAFAIIGAFVFAERASRKDEASRSTHALADDSGTTRLIGLGYAFALNAGLLAPAVSRWQPARFRPNWLPAAGLLMMVAGLVLRIWSAVTLARFYTRTLRTLSDQQLVLSGPYAVIRHVAILPAGACGRDSA